MSKISRDFSDMEKLYTAYVLPEKDAKALVALCVENFEDSIAFKLIRANNSLMSTYKEALNKKYPENGYRNFDFERSMFFRIEISKLIDSTVNKPNISNDLKDYLASVEKRIETKSCNYEDYQKLYKTLSTKLVEVSKPRQFAKTDCEIAL